MAVQIDYGRTERTAFKRMLKERRSMVNVLLERCSELVTVEDGAPDIEIVRADSAERPVGESVGWERNRP